MPYHRLDNIFAGVIYSKMEKRQTANGTPFQSMTIDKEFLFSKDRQQTIRIFWFNLLAFIHQNKWPNRAGSNVPFIAAWKENKQNWFYFENKSNWCGSIGICSVFSIQHIAHPSWLLLWYKIQFLLVLLLYLSYIYSSEIQQ